MNTDIARTEYKVFTSYFFSLSTLLVLSFFPEQTNKVKKIADQLEESERTATTENWGLFLARKEAAFRGQQQVFHTFRVLLQLLWSY